MKYRNSILSSFAMLIVAGTGLHAAAATSSDGKWAVTVITEQGPCEVYRWEFGIRDGRVTDTGDAAAKASGNVSGSGAVNVKFTRGSDQLSATGALSGQNGSGRWSSPSRKCSGRWSAEKQG